MQFGPARSATEWASGVLRRPGFSYGVGALAVVVLSVLAVSAGIAAPAAKLESIGPDIAVGWAFAVAGGILPGPSWRKVLVAAVGAAWLLGSSVPEARVLHQAVLALVLITFTSGRPYRGVRLLLIILAVPLALGLAPQPAAAAYFAVIAVAVAPAQEARTLSVWFPSAASAGVAAALVVPWTLSWSDSEYFDPSLALLIYEILLLVVALGCFLAARAIVAGKATFADLLLNDDALTGLDGLASVLGDALRDPNLRVYRWQGSVPGYGETSGGHPTGRPPARRLLEVTDGVQPVAAVEHRSALLEDPVIANAVSSAVRLAVVHLQLVENLREQITDLEAARSRMVGATDHQREGMANRLRTDVVTPIRRATSQLRAASADVTDTDAAEALSIVIQELASAEQEALALVADVPPTRLGNGRLQLAVAQLAERSGATVSLSISSEVSADDDTETTLFYACSEALTNALKHAQASRIEISISADEDYLRLSVADDGRGGADASGSGLQGLADRLASRGGRLRVHSEPGAGSTVTAEVRRPSARA